MVLSLKKAHHGINVPLFALHSEKSCGIGEFLDLLPLIDWCQRLGMDVLQLLPLNDSGKDPSPYNVLSAFALNPVYLSLEALGSGDPLTDLKVLNHTPTVQYTLVLQLKLQWLRTYVKRVEKDVVKTTPFLNFVHNNPWVTPYAEFKDPNNPTFHTLLQYFCYEQLKTVKSYANNHGVFLLGDLPLFLSAQSVEVLKHPTLFNSTLVAGAPPDEYNEEGQYWGFPLPRWENPDTVKLYTQRCSHAAEFFDLMRIDHVLGLFHLWAIPQGQPAEAGTFVPENEEEQLALGKRLLTQLASSTDMLLIGEDLGAVTKPIQNVLHDLKVPGTRIMRWERDWAGDEHFLPKEVYTPLSLTSVSTHDSETLTLWWKNSLREATEYAKEQGWTYTPTLTTEQRTHLLWFSHHTASLFHVNLLQEYLALFDNLVHLNPEQERINHPGLPLASNWAYRFLPSVEAIVSHEPLLIAIQALLKGD